MKMSSKSILLFILALPLLAVAQNGIQRAATPYLVQPDIQFAIANPTPTAAITAAATATPVPIAVLTRPPLQAWAIEATDMRLVDAFSRWAKKAGVQLRWDAARHVEIGAIDIYEGDVTQAMISALSSPSIANSDFPLEVCFYPNRPTLARVTRRGEQWRDCPLIQSPFASTDTTSAIQK
jgi:hypothetical protein